MSKRLLTIFLATTLAAVLAMAAAAVADPVTGGKSKLAFDQDTGEGFADMGIGITTTGAARTSQGNFKFPIKGGDVNEGPKGEIDHKGGIAFFSEGDTGTGSVKFTQFIVKLGADKAKLFAKSDHAAVRLFDLDLSSATISGSAGVNLKIKDADTSLAKDGAAVLSDTFDFPFHKGTPIGLMTIKATVG
ncbi:MAG: hypothetical protein QOI10_1240 [Solirubrobacterales bacterium]|jgi:hypothetical protein|nr:hypothetical protein [Solirubrobacterales bacterium]